MKTKHLVLLREEGVGRVYRFGDFTSAENFVKKNVQYLPTFTDIDKSEALERNYKSTMITPENYKRL